MGGGGGVGKKGRGGGGGFLFGTLIVDIYEWFNKKGVDFSLNGKLPPKRVAYVRQKET